MQADLPFFEGPEDALRAAVQALGGAKAVAARMWPDRAPDAAARHLLDCLNTARAERLAPSQVMFILRLAHEAGCHGPMQWLAAEIGYEARPVNRAEEADRLAQIVEQSSRTLAAAVAALERMQRARARAAA